MSVCHLLLPEQVRNIVYAMLMGDPAEPSPGNFGGNPRYRDQAGVSKQDLVEILLEIFRNGDLEEIVKLASASIVEGHLIVPPSTRKYIDKRDGGERPIDIPAAASRIVGAWLMSMYGDHIERRLLPAQFAYRRTTSWKPPFPMPPGRGRPSPMDLVAIHAQETIYGGQHHAVVIDLRNAYGELLLDHIRRCLVNILGIPPEHASLFVEVAMIESVDEAGKIIKAEIGVRGPIGIEQGNQVSPCLLNLALVPLLRIVTSAGVAIATYADDVRLYGCSRGRAEDAFLSFCEIGEPMGFTNVRGLGVGEKASKIVDAREERIELVNLYLVNSQMIGLVAEKEKKLKQETERKREAWRWEEVGKTRKMKHLRKASGCQAITRRWAQTRGLLA